MTSNHNLVPPQTPLRRVTLRVDVDVVAPYAWTMSQLVAAANGLARDLPERLGEWRRMTVEVAEGAVVHVSRTREKA